RSTKERPPLRLLVVLVRSPFGEDLIRADVQPNAQAVRVAVRGDGEISERRTVEKETRVGSVIPKDPIASLRKIELRLDWRESESLVPGGAVRPEEPP